MSQIEEPFFNGEWIHNIYPITPPLSVYFRISKCGKYRQYQLRYNNSIMNSNFVPFPNDKDYRNMEKISLEIYHKQKQKKIERQSLILVISKIRNECGYMPRISMKLTIDVREEVSVTVDYQNLIFCTILDFLSEINEKKTD